MTVLRAAFSHDAASAALPSGWTLNASPRFVEAGLSPLKTGATPAREELERNAGIRSFTTTRSEISSSARASALRASNGAQSTRRPSAAAKHVQRDVGPNVLTR